MTNARTIGKLKHELSYPEGNVFPFQRAAAHAQGAGLGTEARGGAMLVGTLVKIALDGQVWVQLETAGDLDSACCVRAIALVLLSGHDVGASLVVWQAPDALAVVLGRNVPAVIEAREPAPTVEAVVDGRRVVLQADEEIVLRCGESSITLKRNGRVVIKGAYVETASRGVNRIKGGTVKIN